MSEQVQCPNCKSYRVEVQSQNEVKNFDKNGNEVNLPIHKTQPFIFLLSVISFFLLITSIVLLATDQTDITFLIISLILFIFSTMPLFFFNAENKKYLKKLNLTLKDISSQFVTHYSYHCVICGYNFTDKDRNKVIAENPSLLRMGEIKFQEEEEKKRKQEQIAADYYIHHQGKS